MAIHKFDNQGREIPHASDFDSVKQGTKTLLQALAEKAGAAETHEELMRQLSIINQFKSAMTNQVNSYPMMTINGDVQNAPDEEDITQVQTAEGKSVLRLKDRGILNGKGFVVLRKNKSFKEQVEGKKNTIFEIRYDFKDIGTVSLPDECVLKFVGGKIEGGIVNMNDAYIINESNKYIIGCTMRGTISNENTKPEWFLKDGILDSSDAIQRAINVTKIGGKVFFTAENYLVSGDKINVKTGTYLYSPTSSRLYTNGKVRYETIISQSNLSIMIYNVTIDGLLFDQSEDIDMPNYSESTGMIPIYLTKVVNCVVKNCSLKYIGVNGIDINGSECDNTEISNNHIEFIRMTNRGDYDSSAIYVDDNFHKIFNNYIICKTQNHLHGGLESHGYRGIIYSNTIINSKTGINIVSNIPASGITKEHGRLFFGNTFTGGRRFFMLWPNGPIRNVEISNNQGNCDLAVGVVNDYDCTDIIDNLKISNNIFRGYRRILKNVSSGSEENIDRYMAIGFTNRGIVKNVIISQNTFMDYPATIVGLDRTSSAPIDNVHFDQNYIINAFNCDLQKKEIIPAYQNIALFTAGKNAVNFYVTNNIIDIPENISIPPRLASNFSTTSRMTILNNTFPNLTTYYVSSKYINYITDWDLEDNPDYKGNTEFEITDKNYNTGDVVFKENGYIKIKNAGRLQNFASFENATYIYNGMWAKIHIPDIKDLKIGDKLEIKDGDGILNPQASQIVAIVGNDVYFNIIYTKKRPVVDKEYPLSVCRIWKAKYEEYLFAPKSDIPSGSFAEAESLAKAGIPNGFRFYCTDKGVKDGVFIDYVKSKGIWIDGSGNKITV